MNDFITLEDINSAFLKYGTINSFYECDTSKINQEGLYDTIIYDFIKVSHTNTGFKFKIENNLWTGGYYFLNSNGAYINSNASYNNGTITINTNEQNVTLVLYLSSMCDTFEFTRLTWRPVQLNSYYNTNSEIADIHEEIIDLKNTLHDGDTFTATNPDTSKSETLKVTQENNKLYLTTYTKNPELTGIIKVDKLYYARFLKTTVAEITPSTDTLILGKNNKIYFEFAHPELIQNINITGTITYNNKIINLQQESGSYYAQIDLSNIYNIDHLTVTLKLNQVESISEAEYRFRFDCTYPNVTTAEQLIEFISDENVGYIQVDNNITLPAIIGGVHIAKDITVIGNPNSEIPPVITMEGYFNVDENVTATFKRLGFIATEDSMGNCFIQDVNSTLNLTDCRFEHFISTNTNLTGSIVYCKTDLDNINIEDDFNTYIRGCFFKNNSNCILHGGQLLVEDCKFLHNDLNYITGDLSNWKNINSAFLYQVDGDAVIRNSVFDIDYAEDMSLCTNNINIGHAQSLITCGTNASINRVSYDGLNEDNKLSFFNSPYNNQAHVYANYYYSDISACVVISPEWGMEDKSICYCRSGDEYIYKQGAKLTRKEWDTENKNHKIIWRE